MNKLIKLLTTPILILLLLFTSLSTPVHSQTQEPEQAHTNLAGKVILIGAGKTPISFKKVGGGVGVSGTDIAKVVDNLNDTEWNKFTDGIKDKNQVDKLNNYRDRLKACGLTSKVAKSNLNFNPFGGVSVYAEGGSCPVSKDIAKEIVDAGGDASKVISYKYNKNGEIVWLEEGGLNHLKNPTNPKNNHINEINNHFFDGKASETKVIDFVVEQTSKNYVKGKRFSSDIVINGKKLHLEIGDNGYIVTAYPIGN